ARGVYRAGENVLIELVVVAVACAVSNHHVVAEAMLDKKIRGTHGRIRRAAQRIAEERRGMRRHRLALERRDAPVRYALVVKVLYAADDSRRIAQTPGHRRIDAVTLERHVVAITVGVFVHSVDTERHGVTQRLIDVNRSAKVVE